MAKVQEKTASQNTNAPARLKKLFQESYRQELKKELKLGNIHQVPALEKVIVNIGLGRAKEDKKMFEAAANTLLKITGQKPQETFAKQSIASFKLREGQKIGLKVTLRGDRMYEFLDRLFNLVLPRLRDFHGLSRDAFDGQGNYAVGITEQSIFPELSFEETANSHGLQIIIVTNNNDQAGAKALLTKFGLPFKKERK